jgi:hypothetical protein
VVKFSIAAAALTIGMIFSAAAQTPPSTGAPSATGASSDPFSSAPGVSTNTRPKKSDSTDTSDNSDTEDDTLQRTRTKDSLAAGTMSRDEGQLTRKPRRRERISVVDSTKKLPTSGTDPKFQGSLLHSSVTSIDYVGEKANAESAGDEVDPRFKIKQPVFVPEKSDESKKKETPRAEADSSPSPTPSPTISPSAQNR